MKKIHGSFILFFMLLVSLLNAQNKYCTYSIESSKTDVLVNEPLFVTFQTQQIEHSEVIFFDLKAIDDESYETILLNEKRYEYDYHNAKKSFTFLVFAKKSGEINVKFNFSIRRASDNAVAQAYVGSRDNVKSIPTLKVEIDTPTIKLNVHKESSEIDAIGDFSLSMSVDKNSSNSYDALNVKYVLQGTGYLYDTYEPLHDISNVSIYHGMSQTEPISTKNGYIYHKEWNYALVSKESFTLLPTLLKYYNPNALEYKSLATPQQDITITPLSVETLLDDEEYPKTINYEKYLSYLYNIFIFLLGFVSATILHSFKDTKEKKKSHDYLSNLQKSKTPQEAMHSLLPIITMKEIKDEISQLENMIYSNKENSYFQKIKLNIIDKIINAKK